MGRFKLTARESRVYWVQLELDARQLANFYCRLSDVLTGYVVRHLKAGDERRVVFMSSA